MLCGAHTNASEWNRNVCGRYSILSEGFMKLGFNVKAIRHAIRNLYCTKWIKSDHSPVVIVKITFAFVIAWGLEFWMDFSCCWLRSTEKKLLLVSKKWDEYRFKMFRGEIDTNSNLLNHWYYASGSPFGRFFSPFPSLSFSLSISFDLFHICSAFFGENDLRLRYYFLRHFLWLFAVQWSVLGRNKAFQFKENKNADRIPYNWQ